MDCKMDKRFSKQTTAMEAMELAVSDRHRDFDDKVALVTGANSGIGLETAVALAAARCTVVCVCRSEDKAKTTIEEIVSRVPGTCRSRLIPGVMECSSLRSVEKFAQDYLDGKVVPSRKLHILVNNAGIMQTPEYTESEDGYELQFAVNYLAGYLLVKLLQPLLTKSATVAEPARVVNVSSIAHTYCRLNKLDIPNLPVKAREYNSFQQYGSSKLLQILQAQTLTEEFGKGNHPVLAFSLHPGVIQTGLGRSASRCSIAWWLYTFPRAALLLGIQKPLQAGAGPTIRCCLDPSLNDLNHHKVYFNDDCQPRQPRLPKDPASAGQQLMDRSNQLVGHFVHTGQTSPCGDDMGRRLL
uniref:Retinol dehydrogenase 12 n=1 Tax=Mucochytrium quahogii TaxID=96639 RepID=A0A7S2RW07_9STRA|mmetsp:Transcript_6235/g.9854  ORF Transcript_6235/g.9854 Transcript_6235/m.9854 type:complete len:355 (+) Transcript_6235:152-1216(+)